MTCSGAYRVDPRGLASTLYRAVAGVLDKPHSQLIPLSGVAVQARQSPVYIGLNRCPSHVAWRAGMAAERA